MAVSNIKSIGVDITSQITVQGTVDRLTVYQIGKAVFISGRFTTSGDLMLSGLPQAKETQAIGSGKSGYSAYVLENDTKLYKAGGMTLSSTMVSGFYIAI